MACTDTRFDRMTQALASGVSRRETIKWIGVGVLGTMLSGLGVRSAEAHTDASCNNGKATCGVCPPRDCFDNGHAGNCICITFMKFGACTKHATCAQNALCNTVRACSTVTDCKSLGHNWFCGDTVCCGIRSGCVAYCGSVPACCTATGPGLSLAG